MNKKKTLLIFSLLLLLQTYCFGQLRKLSTRELRLTVDNDAYYIPQDQYYSSGIFAKYRKLVDERSPLYRFLFYEENISKAVVGYSINHYMFTPSKIWLSRAQDLDRPFAGMVTVGLDLDYYLETDWVFRFNVEAGVLGPLSQTDHLQIFWHETFDMNIPGGWFNQISNTPAIILRAGLFKSFKLTDYLEIINESQLELGTIFDNIKQGFTIRIGGFKNLSESIYTNAAIGKRISPLSYQNLEWYIFAGPTIEYVLYNTTIEGNPFNNNSPHTDNVLPWVTHQRYGFGVGGGVFDANVTFYWRSKENSDAKAKKHKYIGISVSYRY